MADRQGDGPGSTYDETRFNAVTHGVLSRHTVLPWEDADEFAAVLQAFVEEHAPEGPTEEHLVEELAGIVWRKRRLLMAEGARLNEGLRDVVREPGHDPGLEGLGGGRAADTIVTAVVSAGGSDRRVDAGLLRVIGPGRPGGDDPQELREALARRDAARERLDGGGGLTHALEALTTPELRHWEDFRDTLGDEIGDAGDEEWLFRDWLERTRNLLARRLRLIEHAGPIRRQALGAALRPERFQGLSRYEVHLDRKFERTLAMLLKLKAMRPVQVEAPKGE